MTGLRWLLAVVLVAACGTQPAPCADSVKPCKCSCTGGAPATGGRASTGGSKATGGQAATGGSSAATFPACNAGMRAPSPKELDQYRRTLRPRHKSHDKVQRAPVAPVSASLKDVFWTSNLAEPLDQGSLGSCTGNATAQCLSTKPFGLSLIESNAIDIYKLATKLDTIAGTYPPNDTGSTGAFACEAAVQLGYARACKALVGYTDAIAQVQTQPIIVGMSWYSSMFTPNACGGLAISGALEGGHEVEIVGYDAGNKRVWLQNSWGNSWGVCLGLHCGYFYLSVNDLAGSKLDAEFDAPELP